jgi:hypothetical protein
MSKALDDFLEWFSKLTRGQKAEIVRLDNFLEWFSQLTPGQRAEIVRFIRSDLTADFGYFAGPAPSQKSNLCPNCGKPL